MNRSYQPVILLVLPLFTAFAAAADLDTLIQTCDGCHGDRGVSQWTDMPTIAGIDAFVHSEALYIYQDHARPCATSEYRQGDTSRSATDMCEIAEQLEDEDIEQLAEHYAKQSFVPAAQVFDAELAATGEAIHESECAVCHSDGGSNPEDESSILAGQWTGYLEQSLSEYRSGERDQPPRMKEAIDALTEDDLAALINFYASQQ